MTSEVVKDKKGEIALVQCPPAHHLLYANYDSVVEEPQLSS
jgi:hypothetical protein